MPNPSGADMPDLNGLGDGGGDDGGGGGGPDGFGGGGDGSPDGGGYGSPIADNTSPGNELAGDQRPTGPALDYATQGEEDFRAGRYTAAVTDFRHSLIEDPNDPMVMLLLAQAYFADGQYAEAAGATELAMSRLPQDQWGAVVQNYTQVYGNPYDYNSELLALEMARTKSPDDPAIRFLLGFHYGYLKYPTQAVRELSKSIAYQPNDAASRKLHDIFASQIGATQVGQPTEVSLPTTLSQNPTVEMR